MLTPDTPVMVDDPTVTVDYPAAVTSWLTSRSAKLLTDEQLAAMVVVYREACQSARISEVVALTMMLHETASMTYDLWPQPPSNNPAGIGVTGQSGVGQAFATLSLGVLTHVGLLVAYRYEKYAPLTQSQRQLLDVAVTIRPNVPRGVTGGEPLRLSDLQGPGRWATDTAYVSKLIAMCDAVVARWLRVEVTP